MKTQSLADRTGRWLGWFGMGLGVAELAAPRAVSRMVLGGKADPNVLRICGAREILSSLGILSGKHPSFWLWTRVVGDVIDLAGLARLHSSRGCKPHAMAGPAVLAVTALDIWSAAKTNGHDGPLRVSEKITVGVSPADAYLWWRDLGKLREIMDHFAEISDDGPTAGHWKIKNTPLEWDAAFIEERPGEVLRWHSVGGSLTTSGSIIFRRAPGDYGTEVTQEFTIHPPGGFAGAAAAKTLRVVPDTWAVQSLRKFKALAEVGEVPTLKKNSSAREGALANIF